MAGEKQLSGNLRLRLNNEVIFDAQSCTMSMSREVTQTAGTKDTAAGANTKGTRSWTASYNGLAAYAGDGNDGHVFKDLVDLWRDDTTTLIHVEFVPSDTDYTFYYEGDGILTQLDGVFNFSETGTVSLTVTGSGDLTPIDKGVTAPGS